VSWVGAGIETPARSAASPAVEPIVAHDDPCRGAARVLRLPAPPGPAHPAHLEQIGEITAECQRQVDPDGTLAVIAQRDPLMGRAPPEEYGTTTMWMVSFGEQQPRFSE